MTEEQIRDALRSLADHDRGEQAPVFVEARVLAAFRQQRKRTVRPWAIGIGMGLAAAAILTVLVLWPRQQAAPQQIAMPQFTLPVEPPQQGLVVEMPVLAPPPAVARPRTTKSAPAAPREVLTEFYPLMDVMPPVEYGQVYRVTVPASTMRVVGIPVSREMWNQHVQAEVLVGEEGLARAIRFVGYEQ